MILVLGGTSDAKSVLNILQKQNQMAIVTTTTEYGAQLFSTCGAKETLAKPLDQQLLKNLILEKNIGIVIDATHPFATSISETAIKASKDSGVDYIRYERPEVSLNCNDNLIQKVENFTEAATKIAELECPVLLTTGSKNLAEFYNHPRIKKEHIYARVLPDPQVLRKCMDLGFTPKQIVAIQGRCSYEFNTACFKQLKVDAIVTKESGPNGGVEEKIKAATDLGLNVIVIKRPQVTGMDQVKKVTNIDDLKKILCEER